jgi:1-acyl-sn-glycerol-3-phosphate acyltransferase
VFGRILQLFFRRIEVNGADRVPRTGPVVFAVNHPNALVDPLLLLCFAPRPVSFLAKAPLFRMPVVGWFVKRLDSIPVYRRQDQADTSENRETFARARSLLARGGTIAIAPEGTSHSGPGLRPLKTGAARIALGATPGTAVTIVPVGLFYTDKAVFRSGVLIYYGEPFSVQPAALGETGEPDPAQVAAVTQQLATRLESLVINADDEAAVLIAARVEPILAAVAPGAAPPRLAEALSIRQRLVAGYRRLKQRHPALLDRTLRRLDRLERAFDAAKLDPTRATPARLGLAPFLAAVGRLVIRVAILLPVAIPGLVVHYPAYRLIRPLATSFARGHRDVIATAKIAAAAILYPLTWIAVGLLVGTRFGWPLGLAAGLGSPLAGYAALRLVERFDRFVSTSRAVGLHLIDRERLSRLVAERESLRRDLVTLADRLDLG